MKFILRNLRKCSVDCACLFTAISLILILKKELVKVKVSWISCGAQNSNLQNASFWTMRSEVNRMVFVYNRIPKAGSTFFSRLLSKSANSNQVISNPAEAGPRIMDRTQKVKYKICILYQEK